MNANELAAAVVSRMYDNDPFSIWLGYRADRSAARPLRAADDRAAGNAQWLFDRPRRCRLFAGGQCARLCQQFAWDPGRERGDLHQPYAAREGRRRADGHRDGIQRSERFGRYDVRVTNGNGKNVALFRGTVFRTGKPWFPDKT